MIVGRTLQPKEVFDMMNIKDHEEAGKVLTAALYFLVYMHTGDKLETSVATFSKISDDLIHVGCLPRPEVIAEELAKKKIIRIPV